MDLDGVTWLDVIELASTSDGDESAFAVVSSGESSPVSVSVLSSGGVNGLVGVTEGEDRFDETVPLLRPFSMNILLETKSLLNTPKYELSLGNSIHPYTFYPVCFIK